MQTRSLSKQSFLLFLVSGLVLANAVAYAQNDSNHGYKFEQLGKDLRDPNVYRAMDGSPGPEYWQQRADYNIDCTLDVENLRLDGSERITYYNQSPHTLRYLWLQLDENEHSDLVDKHHVDPSSLRATMSANSLEMLIEDPERAKYGHKIEQVKDANGKALTYTINQTMMRVELPQPLAPNAEFTFHVDWHYYITDRNDPRYDGRGGYEYFDDEDDYIFTITQWFPRLCVCTVM